MVKTIGFYLPFLFKDMERKGERKEKENTVENSISKDGKGRPITLMLRLMHEAYMTQTELADKAGLARSCISDLLNGKKSPRMKTAKKIADALGYEGNQYDLLEPYEPKETPVCDIAPATSEPAEHDVRWKACLGPVAPFKAGKLGDSKAQAVKVVEEASELLYAVAHGTAEDVSEELGDVVQAVVNLAAIVGIDTEQACLEANARNRERGRL